MSKIGASLPLSIATVVAFLQLGSASACAPPTPDSAVSDTVTDQTAAVESRESGQTVPLEAGGTHVVLLGTGTPNADPDRSGPAVAIVVDSVAYLVDAGPGVVRRASLAQRTLGIEALGAGRLGTVFLTHLHSDHTVGLPDLMLSSWVMGRTTPLRVVGPEGTRSMTNHLLAAYDQDIRMRIDGLEPAQPSGFEAEVTEATGDEVIVFEDDRVRVTAFRVPHGDWTNAYGYRFETADRDIVISGDTGPAPELIARMCVRCDVLVHEVYSEAGLDRRVPEWQAYHSAFHTSAVELGRIAAASRPGHLVLYHQLLWSSNADQVVREIRMNWNGPVTYGNDLDVF